MEYIIIICIVIWVLSVIVDAFSKVIGKLLKFCGIAIIAIGLIYLLIDHFLLILLIVTGVVILTTIREKAAKKQLAEYINQEAPFFTPELICEKLKPTIQLLKEHDSNNNGKFDGDTIPLGRANAFLSYFETSIYDDEPVYYSPIRSLMEDELREYGTCITDKGIYISNQIYDSSNKKYHPKIIYIPYSGIYKVNLIKKSNTVIHINIIYTDSTKITITSSNTKIDISTLFNAFQSIINIKIPIAYLKKQVVSENEIETLVDEAEKNLKKQIALENISRSATQAGMITKHSARLKEIREIRNYINGIQGHGYAAEYANNTIDKLLGKKPINEAANLDNGHQRKNGADKIVNGRAIQTKYCQTAQDTINAAFKGDYVVDGRMMQIEVPRDQYNEALKIMQEKIDNGEVPGAKIGESAKNYVRKGYVTLSQAHNIAASGTLDGLVIDAIDGAVMSVQGASITALIVFASYVWNGQDYKQAATQSIKSFAIVVGKGTFSWVIVNQLTRTKGTFGIVGRSLNSVTNSISKSKLANSKIGDILGLKQLTSKTLLNNAVTIAVVFGPDICYALSGKISLQQLFKNSVISGTSIAAAAYTGAKVGAVTGNIVGAIAGGLAGVVAGKISKSIMDNFIEDDAKEMFQILKEEFIDVVMLSNLTKEEFDKVCNMTLLHSKLSKQLRNMFAAKNSRYYARNEIVSKAVSKVLAERDYIDYDIYSSSITDVIEADFIEI